MQKSEFDFWRYQIFWEVVGLEWGPLSVAIRIEELLERKSRGSSLESREYEIRHADHVTIYPQKWALTSPTIGGRSLGMVRPWIQATEFSCFIWHLSSLMCSQEPAAGHHPNPHQFLSTISNPICLRNILPLRFSPRFDHRSHLPYGSRLKMSQLLASHFMIPILRGVFLEVVFIVYPALV
jgi:hypothetical protein